MADKEKTLIISIVAVTLFIVAIVSASYAFYTAKVEKRGEDPAIKVTTGKLSANFADTAQLQMVNMIPGDTATKTFSLENAGTPITYKIVINELVNSFVSYEDITYVLKETVNGSENIIGQGVFPKETNALSTNAITIATNETRSYTLTITYNNTSEDQSGDMGKTISGKIFIEEL